MSQLRFGNANYLNPVLWPEARSITSPRVTAQSPANNSKCWSSELGDQVRVGIENSATISMEIT